MADVFISHATCDLEFAKFLHAHLTHEGVSVFLAPVSLSPGEHWSRRILQEASSSKWVLFLASREACASPWVQQEIGAAIATNRRLVPLVWDMDPSELPAWSAQVQAVNLRGATAEWIQSLMRRIAGRIRAEEADRIDRAVLIGLAAVGAFAFLSQGEKDNRR